VAIKGIKKAFLNCPLSAKAVAEKKADWAKIGTAEKVPQP